MARRRNLKGTGGVVHEISGRKVRTLLKRGGKAMEGGGILPKPPQGQMQPLEQKPDEKRKRERKKRGGEMPIWRASKKPLKALCTRGGDYDELRSRNAASRVLC